MLRSMIAPYNVLISAIRRHQFPATGWRELDEIREHSSTKTDISDHLMTIFLETMAVHPGLIVELGVRGGSGSTFVFEKVARICGSTLIGVDIQDCSAVSSFEDWIFVKSDDVDFAKSFNAWCEQRHIRAQIDALFIDTSHLFDHTVKEIEYWFPFLSGNSKVFFHDTNLGKIYFHKDGSMVVGWDNKRGVIAALEEFFDRSFNEKEHFIQWAKGWAIRHYPYCAGLTVLERVPSQPTSQCERHARYAPRKMNASEFGNRQRFEET
jgi:cephalosporin hydroxylase